MRLMLAGMLLLISSACFSQSFGATERGLPGAAADPEFLPVEQAYHLEVEILNDSEVRLYWQIAPGYYLYQHRFAFELTDSQGPIETRHHFPPALSHTDDYFGEVQIYYDSADITLDLLRHTERATLTATSQGCADMGLCYPPYRLHYELDFSTGTATPVTAAPTKQAPAPDTAEQDSSTAGALLSMLLLAFIGGAILNLMPCVFPVLSLKVLSFARSTEHDRHLHSWIYAAGVITSFIAVAALLFGLQQAGNAIGWGFQLQSPAFVIVLAYLFIAMGLSLSGLVEFGGSLMNTGGSLAGRGGLSGSFFTGVLAVVMASPCTAPFMGTALGFAVSQPAHIGLLVFASLGAGMAAPLLLFSYSGAARALMPKPGIWMETLKQLLAFPLYATAIWLLWVAGRQTGVNTMAAALCGALILALGLWLWHFNWWRRALALVCLVAALGLGTLRGLDAGNDGPRELSHDQVAWSEQEVATLRAAGRPVFVDVTADWCITCKANETAVLLTDDMMQAFRAHNVVYMVADWTNEDPEIAALLQRHGRNGIPLYLMYAPDASTDPLVLPQILTRNTVLEALKAVSSENPEIVANY